jgi:F-type H+-transporting ATPase subunit delta
MGIAFEYLNIYRSSIDVEIVTLITAGEINEELIVKAKKIASGLTPKKNIEFKHIHDPSVIGGFILKIGDLLYDASVKRKLFTIKKHLLEN